MKNAALIGLGLVSETFAQAFAASQEVRLTAVHARSAESRRAWLDAHPGPRDAADVRDIAEDPEIDFVVLATPPNARRDIARTLIEARKPVLMEKPVARSLDEAVDLVEAFEAAGLPLGIVFQHRTHPVVATLRAKLPDLGPLHAVEVHIPWWRAQSYYDEPGRGTYAKDGGGVLLTQAIHVLNRLCTLTGPVAQVLAMTATTGLHRMEAEDFVSAALRFDDGAVGTLMASTASFPGGDESIALHARNGSARLARGRLRIDWQDGRGEEHGAEAATGGGADPMAFKPDWHRLVIEDFAAALDQGRPPMVPGREALIVHRLIAALEASGRSGNWEDVAR